MEIVQFLNELRQLPKIEPDPVWKAQTRARLLARFDIVNSLDPVHYSVWHNNVFRRLIAIPTFAFAVVLFGILLARSAGEKVAPFEKLAITPSKSEQFTAEVNLPLATSVAFPTEANPKLAISTVKTQQKRPRVRRRSPVVRTRLAQSIQSVPDARWVFSDRGPGKQASWVFSQTNANQINGS